MGVSYPDMMDIFALCDEFDIVDAEFRNKLSRRLDILFEKDQLNRRIQSCPDCIAKCDLAPHCDKELMFKLITAVREHPQK